MSLHFRDEGDGAPLVLLHGLGAQSRVFDPLFAVRGAQRLIAVDLPRTARSGPWAPCTPQGVTDALLPFLDSRGVRQFRVFGHSFGGLVALTLASRAPHRVTELSVASTPALGVPNEFKLLLANPMADLTMGWVGKFPVWRPALKSYLQLIWGRGAKLTDGHLEMYEEAVSAPGFYEGMLEALRSVTQFQLPALAGTFTRRVLWGEKDTLVSVVQGEQLATALGTRVQVLNDIGHCLPEEAPEQLAAVLLPARGAR